MTDNLFADNNTQMDQNKNYLAELVGEGKKYKDPEALAKAKIFADEHIQTLERERAEERAEYLRLRDEHMAGTRFEELLDRLQPKHDSSNNNTPDVKDVDTRTAFDDKKIESLISSKIQEFETTKRQRDNYNLVSQKVSERFGENAKSVLKQKMDELGLTEEYSNNLARTAPQAFLKLFEVERQVSDNQFQAPPRSDRRSDSFSPKGEKRTWMYYQNLKKTQPDLYNDPKTQKQMERDYLDLGDEFEDGEFRQLTRR